MPLKYVLPAEPPNGKVAATSPCLGRDPVSPGTGLGPSSSWGEWLGEEATGFLLFTFLHSKYHFASCKPPSKVHSCCEGPDMVPPHSHRSLVTHFISHILSFPLPLPLLPHLHPLIPSHPHHSPQIRLAWLLNPNSSLPGLPYQMPCILPADIQPCTILILLLFLIQTKKRLTNALCILLRVRSSPVPCSHSFTFTTERTPHLCYSEAIANTPILSNCRTTRAKQKFPPFLDRRWVGGSVSSGPSSFV